jgi:bifunctional ADP-heptose synthase (sugar kinase/adenylyltransferase)
MEVTLNYKVLVVGDGIIDEYVYVKPQGKSPKENIISNKIINSERFLGGVWAAAAHVRGFVEAVQVQTATTSTLKRRYVEAGYIRKLFETHAEEKFYEIAPPDPSGFDLVIVTDFGHGCLTPQLINRLTASKTFLAVNAQTNSANLGFNLITKYPRADYVVLDELEARLAAHDRDGPLEAIIERLGFPKVVVTRGKDGAFGYDGSFHYCPAMTDRVIDSMGAGDAFFCVTAPFACAGASMPELLAIGNAAGAIKCGVVGHRKSVTKEALLEYLG